MPASVLKGNPRPTVRPEANEARIVTIDIETAPLRSYHWGLFDQNIGLEQIETEWSILSYSAKWLGKPGVRFRHTGGRGVKKVRDDRPLLLDLWHVLDAADIVIAQNGRDFDLKKINARMAMHGILPYSPVRVVDTMLAAKRFFGFTSNKLAWLSKHLTSAKKSEHKRFPGFELWAECLKDNPRAWAEMRHYNAADVVATEELYLRLRPWIVSHPNMGTYHVGNVSRCPKCGSTKLKRNGLRVNQYGTYSRFRCLTCGGSSHDRTMANTREKRATLLGN